MTGSLWDEYNRIWSLAQETCPVVYAKDIGNGIAGAYYPRERVIILKRNDATTGEHEPRITDDHTMTYESCILLHEMAHAQSHISGGDRYLAYRSANMLWNLVNMDGTLLNEEERALIFREETKVDMDAMRMSRQFSKGIQEEYGRAMIDNLSAYSSLLWTGTWPDGKRQKWEGSASHARALDLLRNSEEVQVAAIKGVTV
jgi:hypothetical protein